MDKIIHLHQVKGKKTSSRIWTQVADSISYVDNRCANLVLMLNLLKKVVEVSEIYCSKKMSKKDVIKKKHKTFLFVCFLLLLFFLRQTFCVMLWKHEK